MSIQAWIAKKLMVVQLRNWNEGLVQEQRIRQKKNSRFTRLPADVQCRPVNAGGVLGEWIQTPEAVGGAILYLHGGAYALGSIDTHREFIARLSRATKRRCLALEYRLAPEYPFPAALDDALAAYGWLLEEGISPADTIIAGDSAGGGLALATLVALRDAGEQLPAGGVLLSPWLDLAHTGDSIKNNAQSDPILSLKGSKMYALWYAGDNDLKNPLISPLYADLASLPPLLVQVAADEILLDDATRLATRAQQVQVKVTLEVWEAVFHVFQIVPFLPETKRALRNIAGFLAERLDVPVEN